MQTLFSGDDPDILSEALFESFLFRRVYLYVTAISFIFKAD